MKLGSDYLNLLFIIYRYLPSILLLLFTSLSSKCQELSRESIPSKITSCKIIGFGECIHGTSSFLPIELDIFKQLERINNLNTIVFEIPFEDSFYIESYIHGTITSKELAQNLSFYYIATQEFIGFLDSIKQVCFRSNNNIRVFGMDFNNKNKVLIKLLNSAEIKTHKVLLSNLTQLQKIPDDLLNYASFREKIDSIAKALPLELSDIVANKSIYENDLIILYEYIRGWLKMIITESHSLPLEKLNQVRDSCMARLVSKIYQSNRTGILLIGHNFHVGYGYTSNLDCTIGIKTLGSFLKQEFKELYYSLGTEIYSGKYIAKTKAKNENSYCLKTFDIKHLSCKDFAYVLNKKKLYFRWIDYQTVNLRWINKCMRMTSIGGSFNHESYFLMPKKLNDGILLIERCEVPNLLYNASWCDHIN